MSRNAVELVPGFVYIMYGVGLPVALDVAVSDAVVVTVVGPSSGSSGSFGLSGLSGGFGSVPGGVTPPSLKVKYTKRATAAPSEKDPLVTRF